MGLWAGPNLLELAAEIAEYMVINEVSALNSITYEDTNGDIRYVRRVQETVNERYDFILNKLEEGLKK